MKFLVAVDGSDEAATALTHAAKLASADAGSITVVHAVDPAVYDEGGSEPISTLTAAQQRLIIESIEDAEQRGLELVEAAVDRAEEFGLDVEGELVYGDPVRAISDYAEAEGFAGIFVGHRGRSARTESFLGSVAKGLVERASVPVTVVR